jgi:hypothetical protein
MATRLPLTKKYVLSQGLADKARLGIIRGHINNLDLMTLLLGDYKFLIRSADFVSAVKGNFHNMYIDLSINFGFFGICLILMLLLGVTRSL